MEIVQGEQLFLKPDCLATLKPHYKSEKLPQYTTFKPNNWRFSLSYSFILYLYTCEKNEAKSKSERRRIWHEIKCRTIALFLSVSLITRDILWLYYIFRRKPRIHNVHVTIANYSMRIRRGVQSNATTTSLSLKYTAIQWQFSRK